MRLLNRLWHDEVGLVVSAETMMVGTLGVIGAVTGIATATSAVNDEMSQLAQAFRGFDQSYSVNGSVVTVVSTCPPADGCSHCPSPGGLGSLYSTRVIATKAGSGYQQVDCQVDIQASRTQFNQLALESDQVDASSSGVADGSRAIGTVEEIVVEPKAQTIPARPY